MIFTSSALTKSLTLLVALSLQQQQQQQRQQQQRQQPQQAAQQVLAGGLQGRITIDGKPVTDATISAYRLDSEKTGYKDLVISQTNPQGTYQLASLPTGDY